MFLCAYPGFLCISNCAFHTGVYFVSHDDVIKWKHFPRYWPFVGGIHRSPVNSPHKGQWRRALMFSLICAWTDSWANNGDAGDLRRHRANYDVIVISSYEALKHTTGPCFNIRQDIVRSRKVSKRQDLHSRLYHRTKIWLACQISKRCDNLNYHRGPAIPLFSCISCIFLYSDLPPVFSCIFIKKKPRIPVFSCISGNYLNRSQVSLFFAPM